MAYKHGLIILEKSKEPDKFRRSKTHKSVILLFIREDISELQQLRDFLLKKVFTERNGFYVVLIIQIVTTLRTNFQRYL